MAKIVVLGATGYAGGLAAHALVNRGARPVLAGRNEAALAQLASELGDLPYQVADATDLASLHLLVDPGDVLVTTVGPFHRLGGLVAQAAADRGAHYIDSTGEVGFVRDALEKHGEQAQARGAVMLPAFGNDYVPGILAAGYALQEWGEQVASLQVGYFLSGETSGNSDMSQGTRTTMLESLTFPTLTWEKGRIQEQRTGSQTEKFSIHGEQRAAILVSGTEVLFLPREFPQLQSVTVFNGWSPGAERVVPLFTKALGALRSTKFGREKIDAALQKTAGPSGGPDAEQRARTGIQNIAIARDRTGRPLGQVLVEGPNAYDFTAEVMAWAATELIDGHFRTSGVVGPIAAFGFAELAAACAELGLRRTA